LKRERSTAARSLRAVALVITLVTIVTFSTIAYSAYDDLTGVIGSLSGKSPGTPGSVRHTVSGNTESVEANFTVPNGGLYPLRLQVSCSSPSDLQISCQRVDATIAPGQTQEVTLLISAKNLTRLENAVATRGAIHLDVNISVSLEPFATLSVGLDLGAALAGSGT
jgi:hypothetical protein